MIHLYTLHFKHDYWVDLQVNSIKKHIKVPYKTYAIFSHMSQDIYEKRKNMYDHFEVREIGKSKHKGGNYHATDGNRHIFPAIESNAKKGDIILRMDSDAFLVGDITQDFVDMVTDKKFIALCEPQHEWDTNVVTPHPAFWSYPVEFLQQGLAEVMGAIIEDNNSNWWGGVDKWLKNNNIEWSPITRSNKIDLHPLYFGIYGDLVYHHWAGSRKMISRPDRIRAKATGLSLDAIANENHKLSESVVEQIENQLDTFIDYLLGKYEGEYEES
tara:strand:- start:134 stop:946 length:813 start_codon:yes stop_codon:yes gene_type:complete